jgi:hypothetical protein
MRPNIDESKIEEIKVYIIYHKIKILIMNQLDRRNKCLW